ncbi:MAG: sulfotransferase [Isosphaeraceae bacterium]
MFGFGMKTRFKRLISGRSLIIDRAGQNVTFLSGSHRSGTTWIEELINCNNDHKIVYEPFLPFYFSGKQHFPDALYIRPSCRDSRIVEPVRCVIDGKFRIDNWTDVYNTIGVYHRRLIKDVRTNMMLGWLRCLYPKMPIVLVMRHPIPVVLSQSKLAESDPNWVKSVHEFLQNADLVSDYLRPFEAALAQCRDQLDVKFACWCIENYVPLKQLAVGEVHLVFYEDFLSNPEREVARLVRYLDRPVDSKAFEQLKKPSNTARGYSACITGEDPLRAWMSRATPQQIDRGLYWLSVFGLSEIYSDGPMPNSSRAFEMLQANGGVLTGSSRSDGSRNSEM